MLMWRLAHCIPRKQVPFSLRDHLLNPGSMTACLENLLQSSLTMKVLMQRQILPYRSESQLLNLLPQRWALVREIMFYSNNQPLLFGRSVFPFSSMVGAARRLPNQLNQDSISTILFRDYSLERSEFELAQVDPRHCEYQTILPFLTKTQSTWARRSIFFYKHKPLLVTEMFLPALIKRLSSL